MNKRTNNCLILLSLVLCAVGTALQQSSVILADETWRQLLTIFSQSVHLLSVSVMMLVRKKPHIPAALEDNTITPENMSPPNTPLPSPRFPVNNPDIPLPPYRLSELDFENQHCQFAPAFAKYSENIQPSNTPADLPRTVQRF